MLKLFKTSGCLPCSKRQSSVIHPAPKKRELEFICKDCKKSFSAQEDLGYHMANLCPSSTILDNFSPGAISKPSLNEEHHFVESRKGDSAIFDKFFMRKTYIEKSPKAQTKSLIFSEQSPFGNSPDKTEGSIDRSPKSAFSTDKGFDLSLGINGLEKIVANILDRPLQQRIKIEAKFIKVYLNKKALKKYLVANAWMDIYSRYLAGERKELPPPIDNRELKQNVLMKKYPTPLYAVNETIWQFLKKLYGGGPEISQYSESVRFDKTEKASKSVKSLYLDDSATFDGTKSKNKLPSYIDFNLRPIGMINEGFQSSLIASLQMLLGAIDLLEITTSDQHIDTLKAKKFKYWKAFQDLIDAHVKGRTTFVLTTFKKLFKDKFDFQKNQDACEILNSFLTSLQDEILFESQVLDSNTCNNTVSNDLNTNLSYFNGSQAFYLSDLFGVGVVDIVKCLSCGRKSRSTKNSMSLSLPINSEKSKTIDDCLAGLEREYELEAAQVCEWCQQSSKVSKKRALYRLPKNLIVHFDRFPKDSKGKINNFVNYLADNWKIKGEIDKESTLYSLTGVITHTGSLEKGHYITYTKRGDQWYTCDDEEIKKVSSKVTILNDAYILLYQKKT